MARISRLVLTGCAHHVTQRGNRRQPVFFCDEDYEIYKTLLVEHCKKAGTEIWAYCLMTNHVHLVLVPKYKDGLRGSLGEAHRCYTRHINFSKGWRGHLWQERFASFPMDDAHLLAAVRYVELNPVRAGMVKKPEDYIWSSAKAHLDAADDGVVKTAPMLNMVDDWKDFLKDVSDEEIDKFRLHERTGRPMGSDDFLKKIKNKTGRDFIPKKRGPKKEKNN